MAELNITQINKWIIPVIALILIVLILGLSEDYSSQISELNDSIHDLNISGSLLTSVEFPYFYINSKELKLNISSLPSGSFNASKYRNITQDNAQDAAINNTINERINRTTILFHDFNVATNYAKEISGSAIYGGTLGYGIPNDRRIGLVNFLDSNQSNGGYQFRSDNGIMYLTGNERFTVGFSIPNIVNSNNTYLQMGFVDSSTYTESTDGCYFYAINRNLQGKCSNNSIKARTTTNLTLKKNGIYLGEILINKAVTTATFKIYNYTSCTNYWRVDAGFYESCTVLWTGTVSSRIPKTAERATGYGIKATQDSTNAGTVLLILDFIRLER